MSRMRSGLPGSRCKGDARWDFKTYVALDLYRVLETNRVEEQHQPQEREQFHQLAVDHLVALDSPLSRPAARHWGVVVAPVRSGGECLAPVALDATLC